MGLNWWIPIAYVSLRYNQRYFGFSIITSIVEDVTDCQGETILDLAWEIFLVQIMEWHFSSEKQMFQEKCLYRCQYSTGSTFILEKTIFNLLIEKETLFPRIMQVTFSILEQQLKYAKTLLPWNKIFISISINFLPHRRIHIWICLLV